jgi:capsular exopolysaccharide synthesis family protein
MKSYTQLVNSPLVLQPVIDELGLDETLGSLASRTDATSPLDTVLIITSVEDDDPERAASIANAVGARLATVIEDLESPRRGESPVDVTTVRPATPPAGPVSPRPRLNLALGLLLGLSAGVVTALTRELLDNRVKSSEEVEELAGTRPLGEVPLDGRFEREPTVTLKPLSPLAEPFRTIRTNLQFADVDQPVHSVVITSASAGEGKTTTALNLAIAFAQAGAQVCLVEGDLRRPRLGEAMRVEGAVGLTDVLAGKHDLDDVLLTWHDGLLDYLGHGTIPPNPSELLGSRAMKALLETLTSRYDLVIVDAPPVLPVTDAAVLARLTDGAVLLARYNRVTRGGFSRAVALLRAADARLLGVVTTFVPARQSDYAYRYGGNYEPDARRVGPRSTRRRRRREATVHSAAPREPAAKAQPPVDVDPAPPP